MPTHNSEDALNLSLWFKDTCQNSQVHNELHFFNTLFDRHLNKKEKVNVDDIKIFNKLYTIDSKINFPGCGYLYAYAIEVLKKSAFLQIPKGSNLVKTCYGQCYRMHCP